MGDSVRVRVLEVTYDPIVVQAADPRQAGVLWLEW